MQGFTPVRVQYESGRSCVLWFDSITDAVAYCHSVAYLCDVIGAEIIYN